MSPIRIDPGHFSPDTPVFLEELGPEEGVIQFGRPPNRIDLLNDISGVTFEEAWPGRVETVIGDEEEGLRVPYIGIEALMKNKRVSPRPRDLSEVEYLDRDG